MQTHDSAKIRWAPRLRPQLLQRLYDSDAKGFRDIELCDEVGTILYLRCRTFVLVHRSEVECPACRTVFEVAGQGQSRCPREGCGWTTTRSLYAASVKNHYAFPGRAMDAYLAFYRRYPKARTYTDKMLLIDQLIHSFHVNEKTGIPAKSVASKLLEGNKKAVVQFLGDLSARDPSEKQQWRLQVAETIDRRMLRSDPLEGDKMFQTDFSRQEFQARRARVYQAIGPEAVALIRGAAKDPGHSVFRQDNNFYYLCGVEVPHAYLLLDGTNQTSTLFLAHQSPKQVETEGEILSAENPDLGQELTGVDEVLGIEHLARHLERVRVLYTPMRQGEGPGMSADTLWRAQQEVYSDPWDGRPDRMRHLVATLRQRCPGAEIRDLAPVLDELRLIKSEQELALLRRAGQLSARGVIEAMRSTRPGVIEYQLDAVMRYHYLVNGARDAAYHAIIAGGANAWYGHYSANNCPLQDGDLVLVDCAPDYHYYTSDIGRMWPVNGRYSPLQCELYGFIVEYHKVLLSLIRPGVTDTQIQQEAAAEMLQVIEKTHFSKDIYEAAARRALDFPYHMSHCVGMAVHDPGHYRGKALQPGTVFALDPQMWIPEEKRYIRVEDTVVVTEDGIENLTADAPLELEDVEALMQEQGLLDRYPASSSIERAS
jgi:Xaa-Pro aminopeptidase